MIIMVTEGGEIAFAFKTATTWTTWKPSQEQSRTSSHSSRVPSSSSSHADVCSTLRRESVHASSSCSGRVIDKHAATASFYVTVQPPANGIYKDQQCKYKTERTALNPLKAQPPTTKHSTVCFDLDIAIKY